MKVFSSTPRGTVLKTVDTKKSKNTFFSIDDKPVVGDGISGFIESVDMTKKESIGLTSCFNEKTHMYAFGASPQECMLVITIGVFLNGDCKKQDSVKRIAPKKQKDTFGKSLDMLNKKYNEGRVYATGKSSGKFTCGDFYVEGPIISLSIGVSDPELNLVSVRFTMPILSTN